MTVHPSLTGAKCRLIDSVTWVLLEHEWAQAFGDEESMEAEAEADGRDVVALCGENATEYTRLLKLGFQFGPELSTQNEISEATAAELTVLRRKEASGGLTSHESHRKAELIEAWRASEREITRILKVAAETITSASAQRAEETLPAAVGSLRVRVTCPNCRTTGEASVDGDAPFVDTLRLQRGRTIFRCRQCGTTFVFGKYISSIVSERAFARADRSQQRSSAGAAAPLEAQQTDGSAPEIIEFLLQRAVEEGTAMAVGAVEEGNGLSYLTCATFLGHADISSLRSLPRLLNAANVATAGLGSIFMDLDSRNVFAMTSSCLGPMSADLDEKVSIARGQHDSLVTAVATDIVSVLSKGQGASGPSLP